jgi:hypothetical protein
MNKNSCRKPFGGPRRGWENKIGMDLSETGREVSDWIHLAQNTVQWWARLNALVFHTRRGNFLTK